MNCINCGYERVPEEARYCPECGFALSAAVAPYAHIVVRQEIGRLEAGSQAKGVEIEQLMGNVIFEITKEARSWAKEARERQAFAEEELAKAVAAYAPALLERSEHKTAEPYPGPPPYELTDRRNFYGRSRATEGLLAFIRGVAYRHRLIVLHGESGTGKTSILQAGLAPYLIAEGHLPLHVKIRNRQPGDELKRMLIADLDRFEELRDQPLPAFLRLVHKSLGSGRRLFVFWDQFEEFFLSEELDGTKRRKFVEELRSCLDDAVLDVHFLIAIRDDQFAQLSDFRRYNQIPWILDNLYHLQPLSAEDAQEIITAPVRQLGITYEKGLVPKIITDIGTKILPASLQLVCSALYQSLEPGQTVITHQYYREQHGVQGILQNYLTNVLNHIETTVPVTTDHPAGISPRDLANYILVSLVERVPVSRRRQRTLDDLLAAIRVDEVILLQDVLNELVRKRLISVVGSKTAGQAVYELVHDSLIERIANVKEIDDLQDAIDLLNSEVGFWQKGGARWMSQDRLTSVERQGGKLRPDAVSLDLLFRSAIAHSRPLDIWREYAVNNRLTGELADRWVAELENESQADIAIKLLGSLSDAEAVSRLADFISSQFARSELVSLANLALPQKRAVTALCLMECVEAEVYLRELTPPGFCFVSAGHFHMGSDDGRADESPKHSVWLPAFWMAIAPVTVDEWQKFVTAGAYTQPHYWTGTGKAEVAQSVWQDQPDKGNHPVRNLTWHEAMAYAAWAVEESGLPVELPTEAEWEKAAGWDRKRNRMRRFPWGDSPDKTRCNVSESGTGDTTPLGSYSPVGDSPYGLQDMAGNVLEWTRTQYRPYAYHPNDGREEVAGDGSRVLRGGAFNLPIDDARTTRRHPLDPEIGLSNTGCRVCLRLMPPDFRQ